VATPDMCLQLHGCAVNCNNMLLNCLHVQVPPSRQNSIRARD
jgi:hypothetical protein